MQRPPRVAVVLLAAVLVLPLAVAAWLALIVVPSRADVETFCLLSETSHTADVYVASLEVAIGVTAIATIGLTVVSVRRIGWRVLVPPLTWFAAILLTEYLVALAIGPQPCEGGIL